MSIIELMVGIVVAMLVGLAATQSAMMFTANQRQGVGAGGAAVNSGTVLSAVKDDVSAAGLGFFNGSNFLCDRLNLSVGATKHFDGATFSPLRVTRDAAGDTIDVVYATRVESGASVLLKSTSDGSSASLMSFLPVSAGQSVLMAPGNPGALAVPCLVRTVSANTAATSEASQKLDFSTAGAHNRHNSAVFTTPPGFVEGDRVTQLGTLRWTRYRIDAGNLVIERPLEGTSAVLARDVISFRVQYGVAPVTAAGAPLNTTLQEWADPTDDFATVGSGNLPRIRAMRLGLIVRSPQVERPGADGVCRATDTKPALFGLPPEHLDSDDWNCWRYRTTTVVVPLRNIVIGLR
jgi:type IV pilus assembly protein PilW